jgi:caa(3)-type oxidase subunit IV
MKLVAVYAALLALLAASYAVSFLHLVGANFWINLCIAAAKAGLVVTFFMRIGSTPLARSVLLMGLAFLAIMYWLTADDYLTRSRSAVPTAPQIVLGRDARP